MQDFNFHQHTYRCKHADVRMEDEDYVKEYLDLGFKIIAFTDHCPEKEVFDKREHMRMSYDERIAYLESINSLKEKYKGKIDILTGYEIEYWPGQEANLKELKDETDILILGQHFVLDEAGENLKVLNNKTITDYELERYVDYIETAVKLGLPSIIAHPDLFMFGRKIFGKADEKAARRICEIAEKYNIPIEINLNNIFAKVFLNKPEKTIYDLTVEEQIEKLQDVGYPDKDFWKIASEYNVKVIYGIDTHFKGQNSLYKQLIFLAKKIIGEETIDKLTFIDNPYEQLNWEHK